MSEIIQDLSLEDVVVTTDLDVIVNISFKDVHYLMYVMV